MIQFKVLDLGFEGAVKRFLLMMMGTIAIGMTGHFVAAIIWTMALSVSCILAISVRFVPRRKTVRTNTKLVRING